MVALFARIVRLCPGWHEDLCLQRQLRSVDLGLLMNIRLCIVKQLSVQQRYSGKRTRYLVHVSVTSLKVKLLPWEGVFYYSALLNCEMEAA